VAAQAPAQGRGVVWVTGVLGGDAAHPTDAALVRVASLLLDERLDHAVASFGELAVPDEPQVRVRWAVVGAELASRVGNLTGHRELLQLAGDHVSRCAAGLRYQHHCSELELAQLERCDLERAKRKALQAEVDPLGGSIGAGGRSREGREGEDDEHG